MKCLNLHHVGVWADDVEEMVSFFTDVLGFRQLTSQGPVFLQMGDNQTFEILSNEGGIPRPDIPAHKPGDGGVAGIPHICLREEDLPAWEEEIRSLGYPIHLSLSECNRFELGSVGPSGSRDRAGSISSCSNLKKNIHWMNFPMNERNVEKGYALSRKRGDPNT